MHELLHADCSIRTSADQCLLTAPRSFSQLTTSFIGSQCQGIHSALFSALPFVLLWFFSEFSRLSTSCSIFYPTWLFSCRLLTRSFTLLFLFCFQASFLCSLSRTDINRQLLLSTDIYSQTYQRIFWTFVLFSFPQRKKETGGHKWTRTIDLTLIRRAL